MRLSRKVYLAPPPPAAQIHHSLLPSIHAQLHHSEDACSFCGATEIQDSQMSILNRKRQNWVRQITN